MADRKKGYAAAFELSYIARRFLEAKGVNPTSELYGSAYLMETFLQGSSRGLIYFFDIDGTLDSGQRPVSAYERQCRARIRAFTGRRGLTVAISARTPELMMSSDTYTASVERGFNRPRPLCASCGDMHTYAPLQTLSDFQGLYDFDIIISLGSGIYPISADKTGYQFDYIYDSLLGGQGQSSRSIWRVRALELIDDIDLDGSLRQSLAPIERVENYENKLCNVAPLPYRLQFDFRGVGGFKKKLLLKKKIAEAIQKRHPLAADMVLVDESLPQKKRFTMYLMPKYATKYQALHYLVSQLSRVSGLPTNHLRIIYAGDTMTDLHAMYFGGEDALVTAILPTGSRLFPALKSGRTRFAGEALPKPSGPIENGILPFCPPNGTGIVRNIMLGDIICPELSAPASILSCLRKAHAEGRS